MESVMLILIFLICAVSGLMILISINSDDENNLELQVIRFSQQIEKMKKEVELNDKEIKTINNKIYYLKKKFKE